MRAVAVTILAYLLMGAFFALELLGRKPTRARPIKAGPPTRGGTLLIGLAITTSYLVSPLLNHWRVGRAPHLPFLPALGILMMAAGLTLRRWALVTLGRFYTRRLGVFEGQSVVQRGPYRIIRHPGYLATILICLGLPLVLSNWLSAILVVATLVAAYLIRIPAEEGMLLAAFGNEYRHYMAHTARLLPYVF